MIKETLCLLLFATSSSSFPCQRGCNSLSLSLRRSPLLVSTYLKAQEDEIEFGEKYEGEIDWDAEWKKVVKNENQPKVRPGDKFYKSDAEKTIIKATRSAQEKIIEVQKNMPELDGFDFRSLQGNAAFWLTVLAIISVGSALIAASGQPSTTYNDQSFYI
jgi:hypothetical protein